VNGQECETSSLVLGRLENGTIVRVGEAGGYYSSPVPAVLPGGEYIVGGIGCKQFRNRQNFNGLHGRVTVKAGEVVNAGVLDIGRRSDGVFSRRER
jgi:hypothetical protein